MKNMPPSPLPLDFASLLLERLDGSSISKRAEEGCRENHEHDEEYQVRQPVCRKPVEYVGGDRIPSDYPCQADDHTDRNSVQKDNEETVDESLEAALQRRSRTVS